MSSDSPPGKDSLVPPAPGDGAGRGGKAATSSGDAGSVGNQAPQHLCDVCGAPMLEFHCRIRCWRCGYQRDCSDP